MVYIKYKDSHLYYLLTSLAIHFLSLLFSHSFTVTLLIIINMKSSYILAALTAFVGHCTAVGVVGTAPGFAASTTGGGSATPQYPKDINELKTWLTDSVARVIVLDKE
jgi:hypothetical protein